MRHLARLTGLAIGAAALSGCLMRHVDTHPKPPVALPEPAQDGQKSPDLGPFWQSFNDPELTALVERALSGNFQLLQAWARLEQATQIKSQARAGLFPSFSHSVQASRSKSPPRIFSLGGQEQEIPGVESDNFVTSAAVSYELDLWGRVRAGMSASEQDRLAARADVEAAAMTIAATVIERWLDVIEQRALRKLILSQVDINRLNMELVTLRFSQNDAALSDVYQQRQQIQSLEAQMTGVMGALAVAEQQLAVLVGTSPRALLDPERTTLPAVPPLPPAGITGDLLERRPDLRAARARVVSADYRVAQAIAARLPQITLQGSLGFNAVELAKLFDSLVWSIVGSLAGNVWDGGRADAEIARSAAVHDERVAAYGQALLTALVEVESALALERTTGDRIVVLEAQVATAAQTLTSARERFAAGLGNYLAVLTALRSLQQAEQGLLSAQRQAISQRIQVHRALGSDWTRKLEAPEKLQGDPQPSRDEKTQ